jgi:hypothetical protein
VKGSVLSFAAALAAGLTTAGVAFAAPQRDFRLGPVGGALTAGTATVKSVGLETAMELTLTGLPKGKFFRVVLNAGTCAHQSASVAPLGGASARANGTARYSSLMRRNGAPIAFKTIADGKHVIAIVVGTKTVACGSIPA